MEEVTRSVEDVLVRLEGASRVYASEAETVHAAKAVDLVASAGDFLCLHGSSGSGKTTLLNLMAGLDDPTAGSVTVRGVDVGALRDEGRVRLRREVVGVVHQDDALVEEFTAAENVALPLEVGGHAPAAAKEAAIASLQRVGMADLADRFPRQLSGG